MTKLILKNIPIKSWLHIIVVSTLIIFLCIKAFDPFIAERHYRDAYHLNFKALSLVKNNDLLRSYSYYNYALEEFDKAIEYAPWETQYLVQKGRLLEEYFSVIKNDEKKMAYINDAEKIYKQTIEMDPNNPWFRNRLAVIYLNKYKITGDVSYDRQAEELIKIASELDDQNPLFQINYGSYLHRHNRETEAIPYYERVIEIDADFGEAYYNLADIARKKGQLDLAISYYEDLYQRFPDFQQLRLVYSSALIQDKQLEKAANLLQELLDSDTSIPQEAVKSLATIYHQLGTFKPAAATFDILFKQYGYDPSIFQYYIQSLLYLNNIPRCLEELDRFLLVYPDDVFANNQKQKIQTYMSSSDH